jgi:hypothetical protein
VNFMQRLDTSRAAATMRAVRTTLALAVATIVTLAVAARAEILDVPRDRATIQAAVDAVGPNDTVVVEPGTYRENVVVSGPSHDGLQIYTAGAVVIDGQGTAPAITVRDVRDVGLHGFTVHSGGDGVVVANAAGILVDGLTAADCAGDGIRADASFDVTIASDVVSGAGGRGIAITGTNYVTVKDDVLSAASGDGLTVSGSSDVSLCGNDITGCGGSGVSCTDVLQLLIDETHVDGVAGHAVAVTNSVGVAILANDLGDADPATTVGGDGVHVESSEQVRVSNNAVTGASGAGVSVTGDGATIQWNTISGAGGSGVVADGASNTVDGNRISFAGAHGISVRGGGADVADNIVYRPANDGVCVMNGPDDAGVTVQHNLVTRPGADGLDLGATCHSYITHNTVTRARGNGVELAGTGNVVDGNQATKSRGYDLFEGSDPAANDFGTTNRFRKTNKRHRHGR